MVEQRTKIGWCNNCEGANENVHFTTILSASMSTGMFQTLTSRYHWLLPVLNAEDVSLANMDAVLTTRIYNYIPT